MTGFFHVYILRLRNGKHYVGRTNDLVRRIQEHNEGKCPYTRSFRPVRMVYYASFESQFLAIAFEKYLKSGSGRAFMRRHLI
jgi:predicted GIY-YIG superfamily endonuclease